MGQDLIDLLIFEQRAQQVAYRAVSKAEQNLIEKAGEYRLCGCSLENDLQEQHRKAIDNDQIQRAELLFLLRPGTTPHSSFFLTHSSIFFLLFLEKICLSFFSF